MAFLSDLDKKISMLSQGAIQKTKEVTDTAKMSAQVRSFETQKQEALEQLGQIYYNRYLQYGEILEGEAAGIAGRIRQFDEQKQRIIEEMQKIKGTMFCPNCNTEIPVNSRFCNVCGAKIDSGQMNTMQNLMAGKVCSQCGAPLEDDQLFCINCGTKVEQTPAPVSSETIEEMPVHAEETVAVKMCPNCGKELRAEQKFCTSCGTKLQ